MTTASAADRIIRHTTRKDEIISILMSRSNGEMATVAYALCNGDLDRSDLTDEETAAVNEAVAMGLDWEDFGY